MSITCDGARVRPCPARSTARAWRGGTWPWPRARTAAPATSPVEASTPLGTSAATTVAPRGVDVGDHARDAGRCGAPVEPVPEQRVDDPVRAARAARPRRARAPGPGSRPSIAGASSPATRAGPTRSSTSTSRPAWRSSRAATSPSPPLLPLPHTTAIRPAGTCSAITRASPSPARSISSSDGMPCVLDRPAVRGAHQLRVGERLQPAAGPAHATTATAPAMPLEWVSETCTAVAPSSPGARAAAPPRRTTGGSSPPPRTSTSCQSHVAQRQRLGHRLLGAEAHGEVPRGLPAGGGEGALVVGEQALGEARAAGRGHAPGGRSRAGPCRRRSCRRPACCARPPTPKCHLEVIRPETVDSRKVHARLVRTGFLRTQREGHQGRWSRTTEGGV